jgi:hypothetical protein
LIDWLGAGSDNFGHSVEEPSKAVREHVFGRVAIPGSELLAEMGLDAGI